MVIQCPRCGNPPRRNETRYGLRLDCCGLWAWGEHPLVDRQTHEARRAAHEAFDPIWKEGWMRRNDAYKMLARELNMTRDECHMKLMSEAQAKRVPAIAAMLMENLSGSNQGHTGAPAVKWREAV